MKKSLFLGVVLCSMALVACGGGNGGDKSGSKADSSQTSASSKNIKGPFTVKFDLNGGEGTIPDQVVARGGLVTEPTVPTRVDSVKGTYTFVAWYAGDTIWSFPLSEVTSDITLKAKWLDKYTVTFEGVSDPATATQYVNRGDAIPNVPADPTNGPAGKKFFGWRNKLNGGQIWDFQDKQLKMVMEDLEFEPYFVDNLDAQCLEGELCPNILKMKGATYSGGSQGRGMTARDSHSSTNERPLKASGNYIWNEYNEARYATSEDNYEKTFAGFVHNMHIEGNFLLFEFNVSAAATNVPLLMRACAEYGINNDEGEMICSIDENKYQVIVNDQPLKYGSIRIHNVIYNKYFTFQDFALGNISLNAGKNTIKVLVNNNDFVGSGSSLVAQAPVFDCFKLFTQSTIDWEDADVSVMDE